MAISLNSVIIRFSPSGRRTYSNGSAPSSGLQVNLTNSRHRFCPLASMEDGNDTETISEDKPSSNPPDKNTTTSEASSNGAATSTSGSGDIVKRSTLTARERLRAARVLSRYTESPAKSAKPPELGSRLLDALQETDKGKGSEGPDFLKHRQICSMTAKEGCPMRGGASTFQGVLDVFFIAFSFVFISTLMFATTYIVWKVGAIHFNEY